MRAEDRVRERRLLPLLRVRRELLHHEGVDRLAQRLVLLGEDEVAPRRGVIGLLDIGRGHSASLRAAVRLGTQMPFETLRYDVADRRRHDRPGSARGAQRALGRAARRPAGRVRRGARRRRRALRRADLDAREGLLRGRRPRRLRLRAPLVHKHFAHRPLPAPVPGDRRARQADAVRRQRPRARGRARARAGVRPDHRQGGRALRHARDQRRGLPVHDHGADLPQRRAQEDQRAAAAGRADRRRTRPSGSGSSTRSCRTPSSTPRSPTGRAGSRPSRRC